MSTEIRIDYRREFTLAFLLLLAMVLTRSHHFATMIALPDASWATFFLAGTLSRRWYIPAFLMLGAGIVDYLALSGGVSDYCVTPAYPFLIPTYLTLWAAGRWAQVVALGSWRSALRITVAVAFSVTGAFLISNLSFYAFAGYFSTMRLLDYSSAVIGYYPRFLEGTAIYCGIVLGIVSFWRARSVLNARVSPNA